MTYIVDRIEEDIAVLQDEQEALHPLPLTALPDGVRPGLTPPPPPPAASVYAACKTGCAAADRALWAAPQKSFAVFQLFPN